MAMSDDQLAYARMLLSDPGSSAIQSLLIQNATAGTFTISYSGQTTSALAYNAPANEVQNALSSLSNVGLGNISVNNGPTPGSSVNNTPAYDIYFVGTLGEVAQPLITVDTSLLVGIGASGTVQQVAMGGIQAFSDTELGVFYSNNDLNFYLAIAFAFRALEADLSRLHDYVAGQSQEKMSQVTAEIKRLADFYQDYAFAATQVQIVGMVQVPPKPTAYPRTVGVPSTSLQIAPPWGAWGTWRGRGRWG
jgi:hypothetical protein